MSAQIGAHAVPPGSPHAGPLRGTVRSLGRGGPADVALTGPTLSTTNPVEAAGSTYDAAVLAAHPVAFWSLDGTTTDQSDHGHTASVHGGAPTRATLPDGESAPSCNDTWQ